MPWPWVYLRTKGCSETNDLAPVTQRRRTTDEKGKRSDMGTVKKRVGGVMEATQTNSEGSGRGKGGRREKKIEAGSSKGQNEIF